MGNNTETVLRFLLATSFIQMIRKPVHDIFTYGTMQKFTALPKTMLQKPHLCCIYQCLSRIRKVPQLGIVATFEAVAPAPAEQLATPLLSYVLLITQI